MTESHHELADLLWPQERPSKVLRCRHCGKKNRVDVPRALFEPETCRCGACHGALFLERDEPLTDIASTAYEHSLDRASLQALKAVPGFPAAVRWLIAQLPERLQHLQALAATIRCDEQQFPALSGLLDQARRRLDIPYRPALYLDESPYMNAMTIGVEHPLITVNSALLDQFDDEEVIAVLAHELGHLHADHVLYMTMARILVTLGRMTSNVISLLSFPIQLALLKWQRCAELTADRAGLLGCRDLRVALSVQLKMAGGARPGTLRRGELKLGPFITQARELEQKEMASWLDNSLLLLLTVGRTHPYSAWRLMHLLQWVENGNYLDIMAGEYARVKREAPEPEPA
ncbi:MAG: M48 family metallopeptidase [Pseudomonadota bacterium]